MIKKFVVEKNKWVRGGNNGNSMLLNKDGYMCCLGFLGKACGVKDHEMYEEELPYDCSESVKSLFPDWLHRIFDSIASINDNQNISEVERINKLKMKFKKLGIDMVVK